MAAVRAMAGTLLVLVLHAGCGGEGDQDLFADLDPQSPCWGGQAQLRSIRVRVAEVSGSQSLVPLAGHDECIPADITLGPKPLGDLFRQRGYVVREVSSTKTTTVAILGYGVVGCKIGHLFCLVSEPIPPEDRKTDLQLTAACPALPVPWEVCKRYHQL